MTSDYAESNNAFTGKLKKVILNVSPIKLGQADRDVLEQGRARRREAD